MQIDDELVNFILLKDELKHVRATKKGIARAEYRYKKRFKAAQAKLKERLKRFTDLLDEEG